MPKNYSNSKIKFTIFFLLLKMFYKLLKTLFNSMMFFKFKQFQFQTMAMSRFYYSFFD